jgi:ribosomal protein L37AE/L43A
MESQATLEGSAQLQLGEHYGVDPLAEAAHWARHNPAQVRFVLQLWAMDKARNIAPSMDYYWHCIRRAGFNDRATGEPVVCNDQKTSVLARWFKREYGIPFQTRDAKVDGYKPLCPECRRRGQVRQVGPHEWACRRCKTTWEVGA